MTVSPIDFPCQVCRVGPGEKCKRADGKPKKPCPGRGGALNQQHQRSAERKNEKLREKMPLFADQMPQHTAQGEYERWRRNIADGVERGSFVHSAGVRGLNMIELHAIERVACRLIPEHFEGLKAYARQTYPSVGYWRSFWAQILTGRKEVVYRYEVVEEGDREVTLPNGHKFRVPRKVVPAATFPPEGWIAPLTVEQFDTMFPDLKHPHEAPDDGGAWDRLQLALSGNGSRFV